MAYGYIDMGASIKNGLLQKDNWENKPTLGKIKLANFEKSFAKTYNS